MTIFSMKCPKCGLIQMRRETCKSCGTKAVKSSDQPLDSLSQSIGSTTPSPERLPPQAQQRPSQIEADSGQVRQLSFHGTGETLFGINIINILLKIITFGIYSFWGRMRVRRYLLSQTQFEGDRFAYHGTGKELLIGFLKAVLVFGVPIGLLNAVEAFEIADIIKIAAEIIAFCIVMVLIPFATVAARRYRMSRTSWRGIRFTFRGRIWDFIKLFLGGSLLTTITLGLYYPVFATKKYAFMASHSFFGNEQFQFDGRGRDLLGSFLLALVLTIPTLGFCWFWFAAKKHRYFWDHTSFATARFHSTVTGGRLLLLKLGNLLLLIVTFGIGWAWVTVRNIRFTFRYLKLEQQLDVAAIEQQAQLAPATGEGLATIFDLDAGFDLG